MNDSPYVDGERFLLCQIALKPDQVRRYAAGDIAELFTPEQDQALANGETVETPETRYAFPARWTDMVVAARSPLVG